MISGSCRGVRFRSRPSGNFPEAFSHVALVNAALKVSGHAQTSGIPRIDNAVE
jgi:hypothetical protein